MSSPDEPEPVQISLEPASSPGFLLIKMLILEFEPMGKLGSSSMGLIYCEPKIRPGPQSPEANSLKK